MGAFCAGSAPFRFRTWHTRAIAVWALAVTCPVITCAPGARADSTFTVTSTADDGSVGTLRWAVAQADAAGAGTQTINFAVPSNSIITLTSPLPVLNNISGVIVVNGSGTSGLAISGNDANRVFFVQSGNVTISNLNIDHALAKGGDGGADPLAGGGGGLGAGGGLFVNQGANVTVQGVTFNHNAAVGGNGGTLSGGGVGGGGGGGGMGGNGGNGGAQGGGGGGGFITNGGDGGVFAGGGGGGLVGNGSNGGVATGGTGSSPGGNGGDFNASGAAGGTFGGGGGGGSNGTGGAGGDFGGGGAAGEGAGPGGSGGFGGGGGGNVTGSAGAGGFGGGDGGSTIAGSGGSGFGGAVFVRQGGTLTILDSSSSGNTITAGASGGNQAAAGQAAGQDLYLMTGVNASFGGTSNQYTNSIAGAGSVTITSGTTTFTGLNTYTGGTTVQNGGSLFGNTDSLQGAIHNNSAVTFDQNVTGTYGGNMDGTGSLFKTGTGNLTLSGTNSYSGGTTVSDGILTGNSNSLQGAITNNAQVVFDQNFDGAYSGTMSGTGSLIKSGSGNLTLIDNNPFSGLPNNSYMGGTTVSGGILTGTTNSLQGVITNNAQVVFDQNSQDGNFNGSISGTGSVVIENGVVSFTGTNSYIGGTTIIDASLIGDSTNLQGNIFLQNNHSAILFSQSFDSTFAGNLSGSGTLYKEGMGSLTLTGTNTVGFASIQQGRLAVNGTLNGDVEVQSGAVLGGNATINGNLYNSGTVAPGNSIGTITVNGDYHTFASATQQVQVNGGGNTPGVNNDLTLVNGSATIIGTTVNVQAAPGTYTAGTKYTFLEATSLSGSYAGITGFSNPSLHAVLGYGDILVGSTDYMTAYFTLVQNQSNFAAIAQTSNQFGVANYIDQNSINPTPGMQSVINTLDGLTVPQQQAALDSMTAQVNGTLAQLQVQETSFLYMMLRRRVGSAFAAGGLVEGAGGGESLAGNGTASSGGMRVVPVSYNPGRSSVAPVPDDLGRRLKRSPWGGWSMGYGLGGNAQSDGNAAGGVYGSGGTIMAIERPLDEDTLIGFFGGYSGLGLHLSGLPQSASANQGQFGGYFLRDLGRTYLLAAGSAGFAGYHESRQMTFGNINATATGTYNGWNPSAYLEQGVRVPFGRGLLQPYGALQYIYVRQNSFTESGAGTLDQSVAGTDTNALRGILGSRLSRTWQTAAGRVFIPELRAAWMHEFLAPSSTLNAVFAPVGGGSFAAQGLNFGRDWALLGAGTQYVFNKNVSLFANYDLQFNAVQAWHAGSGGVQFMW